MMGRAEGTCEVQTTGQMRTNCDVCETARSARWTSTSSCDTDVMHSRSDVRHACEVCGGSREADLTDTVVPQAPPLANPGRGSQESGKVDDYIDDLISSNKSGAAKLRTGKFNAAHWEAKGAWHMEEPIP